jgi:hypothetical protein
MMETIILYINDDSGFYSCSEVLGSYKKHNPICHSIKIYIKTRLDLDYNSPWSGAGKKNAKNFHYDKRSKLDTKYRSFLNKYFNNY